MSRTRGVNRFVPRLEAFESRWCPSCTTGLTDGTLTVTGDQTGNSVAITYDGTNFSVTCDGAAAETFAGADVSKIEVQTAQGADSVTLDLAADLSSALEVLVELGQQHDVFEATLGGNLASGGSLDLTVNGNQGKDDLSLVADDLGVAGATTVADDPNTPDVDESSETAAAALNVVLNGGNGKDTVTLDLTAAAGSEGAVNVEVDGGNGKDTLTAEVTDSSGDDGDVTTEDISTLADLVAVIDGGRAPDDCTFSDNVEETSC